MQRKASFIASLILVVLSTVPAMAGVQNYFSVKYGPAWSAIIWANNDPGKRTGWNAGVEAGYIFDKRVIFGIAADLQWHYAKEDSSDGSGPGGSIRQITTRDEKSFMFPIGGFITIDPMPQLLIHPSISLQLGYNSMLFSKKDIYSSISMNVPQYFYGFLLRAGADANYTLGDMVGAFAGVYGQWADMYHNKGPEYRYMNGWGIRAGLKVVY